MSRYVFRTRLGESARKGNHARIVRLVEVLHLGVAHVYKRIDTTCLFYPSFTRDLHKADLFRNDKANLTQTNTGVYG